MRVEESLQRTYLTFMNEWDTVSQASPNQPRGANYFNNQMGSRATVWRLIDFEGDRRKAW